jgi:Domain of unknown function (DUF4942)
VSTTELVPSVSIANMVNQRAAVMGRLDQAFTLIREASEIAAAANLGMPRLSIGTSYSRGSCERTIADARVGTKRDGSTWSQEASDRPEVDKMARLGIDSAAWQYLMHESGLRSLMDQKARETWDKAIMDGDIPELTDANIRSTFKMLHDGRGDMFERGVIACFKSLAWCYKTNLPQKFGKRIVVNYLTSGWSSGKTDHMDDLMRVLSVLDGKPEPDYRGGIYVLLRQGGLSGWPSKAGQVENAYMVIKTFKNGNGHVTFKRLDLVDKMNLIIAKHYPGALPAPK